MCSCTNSDAEKCEYSDIVEGHLCRCRCHKVAMAQGMEFLQSLHETAQLAAKGQILVYGKLLGDIADQLEKRHGASPVVADLRQVSRSFRVSAEKAKIKGVEEPSK